MEGLSKPEHAPEGWFLIAPEEGFKELPTEGTNSMVFTKDDRVYKINRRDSIERQRSDLAQLRARLAEFTDHIPVSEVQECGYEGVSYTCVIQPQIEGDTLKTLTPEQLEEALDDPKNQRFLITLVDYFFDAIDAKQLFPDIVGYTRDQRYHKAINLILEKATGKIILCDVGLGPHEDTLARMKDSFYTSEYMQEYMAHMREFREKLLFLSSAF